MQAWNIKQLQDKLNEDMLSCHNAFERSMVKAIGGKEIREKAEQWATERNLTPAEVAIATQYGYKAQ